MFFSSYGTAYTTRLIDIPASTGYGEPIQRFFKLKDGEKIVGAMSLDERAIGNIRAGRAGLQPRVWGVAASLAQPWPERRLSMILL